MGKIKKILIAARGEIALRIIRTCRLEKIKTVTLFTDVEKNLPHAYKGDENYCLGMGPLSETYLNIDLVIEVAGKFKVDAIHPGYGFLSENAAFARATVESGFIFIGPSPEAMLLMGDKTASKKKMQELGIPLIPGLHGDEQGVDFLKKAAEDIGYPVLIKASAGGGGKGMRVVNGADSFEEALEGAKREAKNAFGDDRVLLEKYIEHSRHLEIQVLSDTHGQHFHLFERECSIQRRHQKIIEESPSPIMTEKLRHKMATAALKITHALDYVGAGTIEFIYDVNGGERGEGAFYFLEMNTRLQVEHPVTEMVTGLDLVKLQIDIAAGIKLPYLQEDILQRGHALEVRVYGEDPDRDFLPSTGIISYVGKSDIAGVRLESGYADGDEVTIHFDPMLAKIIVHGENREQAILKMLMALDAIPFLGIVSNRDYLKRILDSDPFKRGETLTHFVTTYEKILAPDDKLSDHECAQAFASYLLRGKENSCDEKSTTIWERPTGLRNI